MGRTSWKFVGAGARIDAEGPLPAPSGPWQTAHCLAKSSRAIARSAPVSSGGGSFGARVPR